MLKFRERFPFIATLGATLLGCIAGGMIVSDVAAGPWLHAYRLPIDLTIPGTSTYFNLIALGTALIVVMPGKGLMKRCERPKES